MNFSINNLHFENPEHVRGDIKTLLQEGTISLRTGILATGALTVLKLAFDRDIVWKWAVGLIGACLFLTAWSIYSHILQEDPLVEAMYEMVDGKENFDRLPEIQLPVGLAFEQLKLDQRIYRLLDSGNTWEEAVRNSLWNRLDGPVYRARTSDGRQVMIVKALRNGQLVRPNGGGYISVFVEKLNPYDLSFYSGRLSPFIASILEACFIPHHFRNRDWIWFAGHYELASDVRIHSSISREVLIAFQEQLRAARQV